MMQKRDALLKAVCLAAILVLLLAHEMYYDYLSDDAFISFRYVSNFIGGHGLVYNVGERVEGYTNFLWILLLSGTGAAGLDIVLAARIGGAVFSVATLLLVYRFSEVYYYEQGYPKLVAPALLACSTPYVVWALSGLESQFFTFLLFAAIFRLVHEVENPARYPLSAILFAIAGLARPEGVLFFAASLFAMSIEGVRRRRGIVSKHQIGSLLTFAIVYAPYFLWRWNYYGWFLPNTFYVKVGGDYFRYLRGGYYIVKFVRTFGGPLAFGLPVLLFLRKELNFNILYHLVIVLAFLVYIVYVGGDGLIASRFFVPILPSICVLVQSALHTLREAFSNRFDLKRANLVSIALALMLLGGSLEASMNTHREPYLSVVDDREVNQNRVRVGQWFKEYAKPGHTIALYAAGIIPYYSELYAIDMLGKTDVHLAHLDMPNMGHGRAGHEKTNRDYVISRRPTYIFVNQLTPTRQNQAPLGLDDGTTYVFRSIRIGRGVFLQGVELKEADLWLNFYELNEEASRSD